MIYIILHWLVGFLIALFLGDVIGKMIHGADDGDDY